MGLSCYFESIVRKGQPKVTADADGYVGDGDDAELDKKATWDMLRFKVCYWEKSFNKGSRPDSLHFTIKEGPRRKHLIAAQPPVMDPVACDGRPRGLFGFESPFVYVYAVVPSIDVTVATPDGQVLETKHFVIHAPLNASKPVPVSIELAMISTPEPWKAPKYATIADVLADAAKSDPLVRRRIAVLALVKERFPCTNNAGSVLANTDTGTAYWNPGTWKDYSGGFDPKNVTKKAPGATDCTYIAPLVMNDVAKKRLGHRFDPPVWGFGAVQNKGWIAGEGQLPSVGDHYILSDGADGTDSGHVGILVEIPPDGNGLWICADGGQGGGNPGDDTQLAYFVPRWGLTGNNLEPGKDWPPATARDEARPWLGNDRMNQSGDLDPAEPDRIAAIKKKVRIRSGPVPNPRRMKGYVDLDKADADRFSVVDAAADATIDTYRAAADKLQTVIAAVKKAYLSADGGTGYGGKTPGVS